MTELHAIVPDVDAVAAVMAVFMLFGLIGSFFLLLAAVAGLRP